MMPESLGFGRSRPVKGRGSRSRVTTRARKAHRDRGAVYDYGTPHQAVCHPWFAARLSLHIGVKFDDRCGDLASMPLTLGRLNQHVAVERPVLIPQGAAP